MRYLCLLFRDERRVAEFSPEQAEELDQASHEYLAELRRSGTCLASVGPDACGTSTTLRLHNGRVSVSGDGETLPEGRLAGFMLLEAVDLNDAIRLASKLPSALLGSIDVRPLRDDSGELLTSLR
jgi:hypothetical protein